MLKKRRKLWLFVPLCIFCTTWKKRNHILLENGFFLMYKGLNVLLFINCGMGISFN